MSRMLAALRHLEQRANPRIPVSFDGDLSASAPRTAIAPAEYRPAQPPLGLIALSGMELVGLTGPCFRQVAQAECAELELPLIADPQPDLLLPPDQRDLSLTTGLRTGAADDLAAAEEPYRPDWLPLARRFAGSPGGPAPSRSTPWQDKASPAGSVGQVPAVTSFVLIAAEATIAPAAAAPAASPPAEPVAAVPSTPPAIAKPVAATQPVANEASSAAAGPAASPPASRPAPSPAKPVPSAASTRQPLVLPGVGAERDTDYRILCSRLLATHFKRAAETCSTLMFVAPGPLAPLEFSLVNMAQAVSETLSGRMLLVAGDPRTEFLPASLRSGGQGANDVWQAKATWNDVIRATTNPRIDFAAWGIEPANGSAVPFSWASVRDEYQVILLAGPSAITPGVQRLAAACDAVVIVVGLGVTGQSTAVKGTELLAASGAPLAGCVVLGA